MALIRKLVGVRTNNSALPILERDPIIDVGTLSLLDFVSRFSYPGTAPGPSGAAVKDLVRSAPDATLLSAIPYDGKAFAFTGNTTTVESIQLGTSWRLPAGCTHFAFGQWVVLDTAGFVRSGTATVSHSLGGYRSTAGQYQWGVTETVVYTSGAGVPSGITARANNILVQVPLAGLVDGALHQLVVEYEVIGGNHLVRAYVDKVLVATGPTAAYPGSILQPEGTGSVLGSVASGAVGSHKGKTFRAWMQRLDIGGRSLTDLMAVDYLNRSRFL